MVHTGSVAVSGDGALIVLACFSDGLSCCSWDDAKRRGLDGTGPCRLVSASYDGDALLTADLEQRLHLRDAAGAVRGQWPLDSAPVGLALSALGDEGYVALADGRILGLRMA